MCAGCAMTAAAGASGARAWLQAHGGLGRRGMRFVTVGLIAGALGVSSLGVSGSSTPDRPAAAAAHSAAPAVR